MDEVIVTTLHYIPGYRVKKVLGIVSGSVVRARSIGRDIVAVLRNIAGGEIVEYTELLASSRDEALKRMIEKAKAMGANGVIGVRLTTSNIMSGAAEVVAYGTAVILEKEI
ncbi:MAG: YbjQ family protein [Sulfolobales archaeon]|nr:YbjQ family protein [Sulfolobales archaeon]MCX8199702.1 YbjQ family protein [Sulfolobales archaeon]MDW8170656.1 YbjQ family protein [Desulfurococcaceae archaeon]